MIHAPQSGGVARYLVPSHEQSQSQPISLAEAEQALPTHSTPKAKESVFQGLGWLDRFLALWILLAIVIGIVIGNYVDSVGPALQRGKFVQVSVPIGMLIQSPVRIEQQRELMVPSCGIAGDDVPYSVQGQI